MKLLKRLNKRFYLDYFSIVITGAILFCASVTASHP